jgi:tRNA(fMet)-specific endonuclease VapC
MFLLDTNICIYWLKGTYPNIGRRLRALSPDQVAIPSVVQAELFFGACKSLSREKTTATVEAFLAPLTIIPFGSAEARQYARIRAEAESAGKPIGPNDLLIAATTLAQGATLVTHNVREFSRVAGLQLEDWTL